MVILLVIWCAVGIGLTLSEGRKGSAGLPLAYFLGLSLIHVPGAMLYLSGDDQLSSMAELTREGFEQTVIGMVTFLAGVLIAKNFGVLNRWLPALNGGISERLDFRGVRRLNRIGLFYFLFGAFVYFVVMRLAGGIPSITALLSPLGSLIVVGACLRLWAAQEERKPLRLWSTVAFLPLLPLGTVIQGGFVGFGTYWVLVIVSFLFAQSNRRLVYVVVAPVVFFLGLSLWVNYAAARQEIRQLVWIEQAGISERLQRITRIFHDFKWLDLSNPIHHEAIDLRLNQNYFVGVAIQRLDSGLVEYGAGSTFPTITMFIPRIIWPDKPAVGGGQSVIHDFTGLEFAEGSSFGAGQVFEFYVNFGVFGVIAGFLVYGWLFGKFDELVMKYLRGGDQKRFLFGFLVALALLQPGGNFLEIGVAIVGSGITSYGLGFFINHYQRTLLPRHAANRL
jgi:hypothetical protein